MINVQKGARGVNWAEEWPGGRDLAKKKADLSRGINVLCSMYVWGSW